MLHFLRSGGKGWNRRNDYNNVTLKPDECKSSFSWSICFEILHDLCCSRVFLSFRFLSADENFTLPSTLQFSAVFFGA